MEDEMSVIYHESQRALQDRFDTRRLADRIEQVILRDQLTPEDRAFLERQVLFFLATADAEGRPNCSYKGGDPGFVRAPDERTVAFPSYDGNGMYLSAGNVLANPHVGLLFIDFERPKRLRVNGVAEVREDDELRAAFPGAQFVVRVRVREVFDNCPRYIHRYRLEERSAFVPRAGEQPPIPNWKRATWACDVLPAGDPAATPKT
jgi:predicted pyridoxine 5'-phosphate oxidase superfamily flavin-nucleotide-binding protein